MVTQHNIKYIECGGAPVPESIIDEAVGAIEDMLVRFDGKKTSRRVVYVEEIFYLGVVLEELGRLRSLAQP